MAARLITVGLVNAGLVALWIVYPVSLATSVQTNVTLGFKP